MKRKVIKPSEVIIKDTVKPVEVVVKPEESEKETIINKSEGKTLSPKTTEQEDITTAGQRKVNLIWEFTQATVTISITLAVIFLAIKEINDETVKAAFFIIIGFYFSRTNHAAIGGVGRKAPYQKYEGR